MRDKRPLDNDGNDEARPEEKRQKVPQLASVIVEALKVDSLQKLCSSLEPILRRVVSEEVERALAKLAPAKIANRASPKRIEGPDGRNLQLHFRSRLSLPLFTGAKVEGEQGAAIHVVLLDADTGRVVTSGPEASAKLDITVLEGDFNNENEENWTQEDFESHEVKEREGKRPLLTGELQVTLKEGVGTIGELIFTDNSSWIRSRKFRLGLKVASGNCEGIRIREAKTEAFTVKDHRGELYKKHYPPALTDDVWRLNKIGKDGAFHKKLNKAGIYTVEDFLRLVVRDPQKLRNILGSGMSNKMWESTIEHAKTCVLSGKLYVYYTDETQNVGVIFNNVYELSGLIANQQYYPAESLSDAEKVTVDALVKKAYDNWMSVVEYDGKALLNLKSNKKGVSTNSVAKYAGQPLQMTTTNQLPYGNLSYNPPNQVALPGLPRQNAPSGTDSLVGLALGPPQSTVSTVVPYHSMGTVMQLGSTNGVEDWSHNRDNRGQVDDYFSEEDIRTRSLEMLENEDMQHLLRMFSIGGGGVGVADDGFQYAAAFTPAVNYGLNEDRTRGSGKAVVGWLKLKAALRWGIFIRKIAAEKRAHLEELD
ncbi:calmodulin-binding protein 60 B isoform X2 [Cryptomeria japonica]|uniref:calmodulin-binding protein 60 B isoform X2 n=1 Tax=Cryptomeria japonica TaxID=3369 RepID=UPI0025ABB8D6|nr:calmodulin-binding protein 60 B isoform X2 [Cryptomeria japonica]